ncbi:BH1766 [Halalkalibacterium halodurans C-125]|uniref:BH1766 protein n=1 Tax=Halalkalibacterium halodurans (strain ATCC BAA-125 / DSM 18197 / FERM 7344 / JCM 9153 / C-125) TaxID=272558 RepID=Q9KC08_HALH5|nr:BH1766 [Halalkalibacterium halodurans C-125]
MTRALLIMFFVLIGMVLFFATQLHDKAIF